MTDVWELASSMGEGVCKAIDFEGKQVLGRHHVRPTSIRSAKRSMKKQDLKLMLHCSQQENVVYFWWVLSQGGEQIDKSTRIKAVMKRVDINGDEIFKELKESK